MASSDYINYAIRPNKAVERKLIFEVLTVLSPALNLPSYRYVGLGAPWFVDFIMAHKYLNIEDMISIEQDEFLASRADFNKPYACVDVIHGDSETVLPGLHLEEMPLLVWLDYDSSLEGPVLADLATLCNQVRTGSILIVTVNAHRGRLPTEDEHGNEYNDLSDRMRALAGDLIPAIIPANSTQTSGYPPFLASVLFTHIHRQIRRSGRETDSLLPLFNIGYSDNAPMITLGGVIVNEELTMQIRTALESKGLSEFLDEDRHIQIGVPPLTIKEKASLDQLLPRTEPPTEQDVQRLGFRLKPSQIDAYHRFYRHYPMFGEVAI